MHARLQISGTPAPRHLLLLVFAGTVACGADDGGTPRAEGESGVTDMSERTSEPGTSLAAEGEGGIRQLTGEGPVVVPGIRDGTEWFTTIEDIEYDEREGTLLALQRQVGHVVELTPSGRLVRRFGGRVGQGPEELNRVTSFAFSDSHLFLLDRGNTKILVYDRLGGYRDDFPVSSSYRSVAYSDERLYLLPGTSGHAVDVYSVSGERIGGIGAASTLPVRDKDSEASAGLGPALCTGCQLLALPDGSLIALGTEDGILVHYSSSGDVRRRIDFLEDDPLLAGWRAADADRLQREQQQAQAQSSERVVVFKTYFHGVSVDSEGRVLAAVIPSAARLRERGFEYWVMTPPDFTYRRFGYPRPTVGFYATGSGDDVFALDTEDGGIYRFGLPGGE